MLDKETRSRIVRLMRKEVVPAIGCTEPMAVALCTAKAAETLGCRPDEISVLLSANILKNAMGVGIPGTGMIGLPIAIALGALIGKSDYKLEVLKDLTPEALEEGKAYIAGKHIDIKLKQGVTEKLYIEVCCKAGGSEATAVIAGGHTTFVYAEKDGEALFDNRPKNAAGEEEDDIMLNMRLVYDFATTAPVDEISFITETKDYNMRAAHEAIKGNYGHNLGKTIDRPLSQGIFGKSIFSKILARTASACDARMGGAMIPVMSNSGSGNQGICATNPVAVYAVGTLRLRGGVDRQQLRHNLPHGRQLRARMPLGEEHDSQHNGHDMRRGEAELLAEDFLRRVHGHTLGTAVDGGQVREQRRRDNRRRR